MTLPDMVLLSINEFLATSPKMLLNPRRTDPRVVMELRGVCVFDPKKRGQKKTNNKKKNTKKTVKFGYNT